MGVSFTFLPIAREVVMSEINAGTPGKEAYGKFLGTCILTSDEKTPNRLGGVGKNVFVESLKVLVWGGSGWDCTFQP